MREEVVSVGNGVHLQCPPLISRAKPIIGPRPWKHGPLNPVTHIFIWGGSRLAGKWALWQKSAPQLFTFLGEKVKGEGAGAGLVTKKED